MRSVTCFRWLVAAAIAASLPVTVQTVTGHSMGGFVGGGPHHSMGGFVRGGPHASMGPRFGMGPRFDRFGFRHDDRFFDHHRFFDHDRFFFHHQNRFFFSFDFVSFGFPWWYPWYPPYPAYYPYYPYYPPYSSYYGYPYDSSYSGGGQAFDYKYWTDLAVSVQSELAQRGYYQGAIDGMIGFDSSEAIRAFQAAQGLPVTGAIDSKLLNALGIKYKTG